MLKGRPQKEASAAFIPPLQRLSAPAGGDFYGMREKSLTGAFWGAGPILRERT